MHVELVHLLNSSISFPPVIQGPIFISVGDLSGCEWPSDELNPYRSFQHLKPADSNN